jgi:hypothetical protein
MTKKEPRPARRPVLPKGDPALEKVVAIVRTLCGGCSTYTEEQAADHWLGMDATKRKELRKIYEAHRENGPKPATDDPGPGAPTIGGVE